MSTPPPAGFYRRRPAAAEALAALSDDQLAELIEKVADDYLEMIADPEAVDTQDLADNIVAALRYRAREAEDAIRAVGRQVEGNPE